MRIHRTAPTRAFSTFANALLRDRRISWCASGLLMYLLSLPEGAHASIRSLAQMRKEGRGRIANSLRELEKAGYLRRVPAKDAETGRLTTEYELCAAPRSETPPSEPEFVTEPPPTSPAMILLLDLHRTDPRLALGLADAARLAPLVEEWRVAGASDALLRGALTSGLPSPVYSAPALVEDRLRRKMPVAVTPRVRPALVAA
ncbi:hypothetical protein [Streptomyces sp. NBC_01465]|uniref:hypothetical protein n=1 Tax=Streptomyces sp. NBC_01465 TaxID=2903878 RepID=UPI002E31E739|nr:hypothetical protein [Streptomyces sp. NBC_01465]